MKTVPQVLPSSGPAREILRQKGQFWTPDWVAEAMVAYVVGGGCDTIFDPAVGAGAFFRAAKDLSGAIGRALGLTGTEIDPEALREAAATGLSADDLAGAEIRDFLLNPPPGPLKAIVANPPYIRHHRLGAELKSRLREIATRLIGGPLDGRTGVHVYFLLRALELLAEDGRLAFIMPADTCEGVYAPTLWKWITGRFRLEAVVAFSSGASPFPRVDTNALIFLIRKASPRTHFLWAQCTEAPSAVLKEWALSQLTLPPVPGLAIHRRSIAEGLATGLSRPPSDAKHGAATLGQYAKVLRGVATGANEFFFLTGAQAAALHIPAVLLVRAVGRTRDVQGEEVTSETLTSLDVAGRPTFLFSPDGRPLNAYPAPVQEYLEHGAQLGLPERPLIASRKPWYKMETREPPPFLFAYLGRRNVRFIRNTAGVVPLTGFLCVYPRLRDTKSVERLWLALRDGETVANLARVGKSYGQGCIKVEPRALEALPIPQRLVSRLALRTVAPELPWDAPDTSVSLPAETSVAK